MKLQICICQVMCTDVCIHNVNIQHQRNLNWDHMPALMLEFGHIHVASVDVVSLRRAIWLVSFY